MPTVALLWDAYHTYKDGKEAPETTFKQLGSYVRHTHLKDSKAGRRQRAVCADRYRHGTCA